MDKKERKKCYFQCMMEVKKKVAKVPQIDEEERAEIIREAVQECNLHKKGKCGYERQ